MVQIAQKYNPVLRQPSIVLIPGEHQREMPAAGATFQEELALVGYDDHFWGTAVAAGQGLELVDDADVVMAEDAYQLLGRKMCAASGHKLLTIDY